MISLLFRRIVIWLTLSNLRLLLSSQIKGIEASSASSSSSSPSSSSSSCFSSSSSTAASSSPPAAGTSTTASRRRQVGSLLLSRWAIEHGVTVHEHLRFKSYDEGYEGGDGDGTTQNGDNNNNNWGFRLAHPVPPGTVLLQVPRHLVLEARQCRRDVLSRISSTSSTDGINQDDEESMRALVRQSLDKFDSHEDNFYIFLALYCAAKDDNKSNDNVNNNKWMPWIRSLPRTFPQFTTAEKDCLPFYAKYAADYQDDKCRAFLSTAATLLGPNMYHPVHDRPLAKWAFDAVKSRFWKAIDPVSGKETSELVPIGDMFNHREPPNVAITHDKDSGNVNFIYRGDSDGNDDNDDDDNNDGGGGGGGGKDLFITYGQPSNAHRFLATFGFVDATMPCVWSNLAYPNNPYASDVPNMVFRARDGHVPKIVWDAALYALLQPPARTPLRPSYTAQDHAKYKKYTMTILKNHVSKELTELHGLRTKLEQLAKTNDTTGAHPNIPLIRQYHDLLIQVYKRVQNHLDSDEVVV